MGLFNRGNKKTPEEEYQELYNTYSVNIEQAGYNVELEFAIGQYGNDDIVAGAMIGNFGKYMMMSKYGDLKWDTTTMALKVDGVEIHYNGASILYSDIIEVRVGDNKGFLNIDKQMVLVTRQGNFIFKSNTVFIDVIINIILNSRERYNGWINDGLISPGEDLTPEEFNKLIRGEPLERKNNNESSTDDVSGKNLDRVLRAGELHERGLLSDEEFEEIKKKFLKSDESEVKPAEDNAAEINETMDDTSVPKFCPSCGTGISDDDKFCTNCGCRL